MEDNYIYLIERDGAAIVVDPGEAEPVRRVLREKSLKLAGVLVTHFHGDHVDGIAGLWHPGVKCFGPAGGTLPSNAERVAGGDVFDDFGFEIEVFDTPGHTSVCLSYLLPVHEAVFVGDCLFVGGCGRFMSGTASQMFASFGKLRALPEPTRVYCGHEYTAENYRFALSQFPNDPMVQRASERLTMPSVPSSIGEEKRSNIFFRAESATELGRLRQLKNEF